MTRVTHARPHVRQDVSTDQVNPHHKGNGQSARLSTPQGPVKLKATTMYDDQGKAMGTVKATTLAGGNGGINAGAITRLRLPGPDGTLGAPVDCVYAWNLSTSQGHHTGWIPLASVSNAKTVAAEQKAIASRIARAQGSDHHGHTAYAVTPQGPGKAAGLYVFPNQKSPVANKAQYFFSSGSESQMYVNLPQKGDPGRFGVGDNVVPAGAVFHADDSVRPQKVGLYKQHSAKQVGHLNFVYGYVINNAGQKTHGWMNAALLSGK